MATFLFLIVLGFGGYYLWREFGSLRFMRTTTEDNTPLRRRRALLEIIQAADACITIVDYRPTVDTGLYNNNEILKAVAERRRKVPGLRIEFATAFSERTYLSDKLEREAYTTNTSVMRGKLEPNTPGMFMLADGGLQAFEVHRWGGRATYYDLTGGVGESALNLVMRSRMEAVHEIFDREPPNRTDPVDTAATAAPTATQTIHSGPGALRIRRSSRVAPRT